MVNVADVFHRAASYVDKMLKGARPADLSIEQRTKFDLASSDQPQDCQGTGNHRPAAPAVGRGRGDPVVDDHVRRGYLLLGIDPFFDPRPAAAAARAVLQPHRSSLDREPPGRAVKNV